MFKPIQSSDFNQNQPYQEKNARSRIIILLILSNILTLSIFLFLNLYLFKFPLTPSEFRQSMPGLDLSETKPFSESNAIPLEEPQKLDANEVSTGNRWYFARSTENGSEPFLDICETCTAVRWENYLIYGNDGHYGDDIEIKMYDLLNNSDRIIFRLSDHADKFYKEQSLPVYISDMKVVDNILFFSLGGYLLEGGTFWIDLNNPKTANLIIKTKNARLYQKNSKWLISSGAGDSCWGEGEYHLLDVINMKVVSTINYKVGCNEGDDVIGIDKSNNFVIGFHTMIWGELGDDNGSYKYIELANIENPNLRTKIIPEENMPEGITEAFYYEQDNKIWLIGNESFFFDISSGELLKVDESTLIPAKPWLFEEHRNYKWSDNIELPRDYVMYQGNF